MPLACPLALWERGRGEGFWGAGLGTCGGDWGLGIGGRALTQAGVETLYVEPGSPWENGYAESFHSRLRDELTNREEFTSLAEAKYMADAWRLDYNHRRPHSSLGYRTPAEFAAGCAAAGFAALSP